MVLTKQPRCILDGLYAFAPNRATLGGTAYLLTHKVAGESCNLLVDSPAYNSDILAFIESHGGVAQWVITHRGAIGEAKALQAALACEVVIQEQAAYLIPEVVTSTYQIQANLALGAQVIWTPGHSPGASCVYAPVHGGILFTGRHLMPDPSGNLKPFRVPKTFHWLRQLRSVADLQARFPPKTVAHICPGANIGFLRGQGTLANGGVHLHSVEVTQLRNQSVRPL